MFKSQQYRAEAAEYGELVKGSTGPDESRKFQERQDHLASLADNEQGLANNYDNALQVAEQDRARGTVLADEEEHVLRCLGAAIIMQWNALPHDAVTRDFRHDRIGRRVIGDGGAPWADRPISAQAQE